MRVQECHCRGFSSDRISAGAFPAAARPSSEEGIFVRSERREHEPQQPPSQPSERHNKRARRRRTVLIQTYINYNVGVKRRGEGRVLTVRGGSDRAGEHYLSHTVRDYTRTV